MSTNSQMPIIERHLKCDTEASSCKQCQQFGIKCDRSVNVRFRHFLHSRKSFDQTFPERRNWLKPLGDVRFYDETPALINLYNTDQYGEMFLNQESFHSQDTGSTRTKPSALQESHQLYDQSKTTQSTIQMQSSDIVHEPNSINSPFFSTGTTLHASQVASPFPVPTPDIPAMLESPHSFGSHEDVANLLTEVDAQLVQLTDREGVLMRNFIENMALWADITDLERHFEIDVPGRALKMPLLRYAIFAFSSRHLHGNSEFDSSEAVQYHNLCLQHLIPAISRPESDISEEILAAIAILRQYEEMEVEDHRFHLTGTIRILNSKSNFACSGGLGEAAAWLCLRQDVYISLVSQKPLRTDLEKFRQSSAFRRNDDLAWTNRMIFLLAKVLTCAFTKDPSSEDSANLKDVDDEVENWRRTRPATFDPIRFVPRGREIERRLPEIWMLAPFHVVGTQYYHVAKIVLAVSAPRPVLSVYDELKRARQREKFVRMNLLIMLGLAVSNERAENALFMARHSLSVWGGVLRHPFDQDAAISFLKRMENITGWGMTALIKSLREQWDEDSDHG